ncbi:hypothetical protein PoB_001832600 [Plakobranchus ocellatus]|uniref:Uncharacterized protein n=1 Tax=Plakobranchus ocellatus TaxID=259542 RepID=A0AAV3YXI5_9GAST|nr:hypothetical protein PoB_001832600 [Plakobranchus ocellatus]
MKTLAVDHWSRQRRLAGSAVLLRWRNPSPACDVSRISDYYGGETLRPPVMYPGFQTTMVEKPFRPPVMYPGYPSSKVENSSPACDISRISDYQGGETFRTPVIYHGFLQNLLFAHTRGLIGASKNALLSY